jgi:hypothetical protein
MIQRNEVTRTEWRWVIKWIIIALIITSLPYVIGWARSTPDHVYGGFVLGIEDGYQYLAMMNEGAHGAWLFTLPYTSEPHTPTLFYFFHLLLGKAAALTGLTLAVVYHLARLICGAVLLAVIYRFIAAFSGSRAVRRIAFLIIAFSGGLGWLLLLLGQANWLGSAPIDLISPEAFTYLVLYGWPHIALARTLMLAGLILLWTNPTVSRAGLAGVCWLGMGLLVPLYIVVVYAVAAVNLLAASWVRRRIDRNEVRNTLIAGSVAAPLAVYTFIIVQIDPVWAVWQAQLVINSLHPLHYVAGFALIGGLALLGGVTLRRRWRMTRHGVTEQQIAFTRLMAWVLFVPVFIYVPLVSQRRLIEGWQIPLSIFASIGLVYRVLPLWRRSRLVRRLSQQPRYSVRGLSRWAVTMLLFVSSATYVLLLSEQSVRMLTQPPPAFRTGSEIGALAWLNQQATYADVVLSSYDTGNFLPTRVAARVFLGHGPETVYSDQKREFVAEFFSAAASNALREKFLRDWPITYIFYGPLEKQLGVIDLSGLHDLALVYDQNDYQIYRVKR